MKKNYLVLLFQFVFLAGFTQTFGPNNPSSGTNNPAIGTNAWTNPGNIFSSDDVRSSINTLGISNYLVAKDFGFAVPNTSAILGIKVEVEKRHIGDNVTILDNWTSGTTKTVSAGAERCLLVVASMENGDGSKDITGMTYGGQAMTQLVESVQGGTNAFVSRLEVWYLVESGITAAASTDIVPTYGAYPTNATEVEFCIGFVAATFINVDQTSPYGTTQVSGDAVSPYLAAQQLGAPVAVSEGGMAINAVMSGNMGTYAINSAYTEGFDGTFNNPGTNYVRTGIALELAEKQITVTGTEQPTATFSTITFTGTSPSVYPNAPGRHAMAAFCLKRRPILDNEMRILKGGAILGTNIASAVAWPTTESVVAYGGASELWGTTWTVANVNAADFGAAISANILNGTANVDHIKMTVFAASTLPIELIGFTAQKTENHVSLNWLTGSEKNNDYFDIERTRDGITYEKIGTVKGSGNSSSLLKYEFKDLNPRAGCSYYRLKQVDYDGQFEYSPVESVTYTPEDTYAYPNPTQDGLINIDNSEKNINEISVYSSDLKFIKTAEISKNVHPIVHIEDLPDGIYFLLIHELNETHLMKVQKDSSASKI